MEKNFQVLPFQLHPQTHMYIEYKYEWSQLLTLSMTSLIAQTYQELCKQRNRKSKSQLPLNHISYYCEDPWS